MSDTTVLVVEDEKIARTETAEFLKHHNYQVRRATSGKNAITKVSKNGIELILMDLAMPGEYDGIEAAKRIRHINPDLPIIFLTGHSHNPNYQNRVRTANLSNIAWFAKPVIGKKRHQMLSLLEKELKKAQIRRTIKAVTNKGISPGDVLKIIATYESDMKASETIKEIESDLNFELLSFRKAILNNLEKDLKNIRNNFSDIHQRQFAYACFKKEIMEGLWEAYKDTDKVHRQLAMLLRMAIRKISSLHLTVDHLNALEISLRLLAKSKATSQDVIIAKQTLRQNGIETIITLGERTDQLLKFYEEEE